MQKNKHTAAAETELIAKLRAAVETSGRLRDGKMADVEALLKDSRSTHTTVLGLLHGRIRDLLREKSELELSLTSLQAELLKREEELRESESRSAQALSETSDLRRELADLALMREELQKKLDVLQVEKASSDAIMQDLEKTLGSERENFAEKSKAQSEELNAAAQRIKTLSQEKSLASEAATKIEAELARLKTEFTSRITELEVRLRASEDQRENVLREKAATEERLAKIQDQWERISRI